MHIKIIIHIIVCEYIYIILISINHFFFSSDYDQSGQGTNGPQRYYDKQSKRKKKIEGSLGVDPNVQTGNATSKSFV